MTWQECIAWRDAREKSVRAAYHPNCCPRYVSEKALLQCKIIPLEGNGRIALQCSTFGATHNFSRKPAIFKERVLTGRKYPITNLIINHSEQHGYNCTTSDVTYIALQRQDWSYTSWRRLLPYDRRVSRVCSELYWDRKTEQWSLSNEGLPKGGNEHTAPVLSFLLFFQLFTRVIKIQYMHFTKSKINPA